jgi:hypothetical protein
MSDVLNQASSLPHCVVLVNLEGVLPKSQERGPPSPRIGNPK